MTATISSADIVDIQFPVAGRAVPVDYADALWQAIRVALPDLMGESSLGVHPLSGLSHGGPDRWNLSRRSRLSLRLPREQLHAALALSERQMSIGDETINIGEGVVRELSYTPVIFSQFVTFAAAGSPVQAEDRFVESCLAQFADWGVKPQMFCGKARQAMTALGGIGGFSLLLANLDEDTNLYLQRHGLGVERQRGCGLFVPHKTFSAVTLE